MRFNQFTFTNLRLKSEHISLRFCDDGTVRHLSRDKTRSVRPVWNAIGLWRNTSGTKEVDFFTTVPYLWVAGTYLTWTNVVVTGAQVRPYADVDCKRTVDVTDPESGMRRKSVDLGDDYTSESGAAQFRTTNRHSVDVNAMHAAIQARKSSK